MIALAAICLLATYALGAWLKWRQFSGANPRARKRALLWFIPYRVYYRQDLKFLRQIKDLGTDD